MAPSLTLIVKLPSKSVIGDCAVRGSFLHHCGTDNRFAFCVNDGTFDLRLRVHKHTDREENKTQKKFF